MKYLAAYLLAQLNDEAPTADNVKKILSAVGAEIDNDRLQSLFKEIEGKDVKELIENGKEKMATLPAAGAAPGGKAGGESKQEEEEEEEEEESDEDMGLDLFG
eukprot:gb/GECH01003274.1/.p1 GENE.gb/GECH01003274.1/~~gb/GECH01003274.1/.p1  ORF type:complete len:103 (+),score=43.24 gb/GECH01003274.1/:1-309(+)